MSAALRMLVPRDGWDRVSARVAALDVNIDPVILERDGSCTHDGVAVDATQTGFTASWFSPDVFVLQQDRQFLDLMIATETLQWMQSGRAGFDDPAFAKLAAQGVRLSMCKATAPAIGEFVVAAAFDYLQNGPERRAAQLDQLWQPFRFREVAGSRWLIVGYGAIGREVALRGRALGAHVTGVRRRGGTEPDVDVMVTPQTSAAARAEADIVVLSVPVSADNDSAYGAAFFAGFKPGALFINVARGQLVDEGALRAALDSGQVGYAALDVARTEPLPPGAWQWSHPRVSLTPHIAGSGSGLNARVDLTLLDNLPRYLQGQPLKNELDPAIFK